MREDFFLFFFSLVISHIYENLTVGIRRAKNEKCSTRRGLRVGTKKEDFTENSGKNLENPNFWFFSDLRRSNGQNFRTKN